jgi:hypothetical protein
MDSNLPIEDNIEATFFGLKKKKKKSAAISVSETAASAVSETPSSANDPSVEQTREPLSPNNNEEQDPALMFDLKKKKKKKKEIAIADDSGSSLTMSKEQSSLQGFVDFQDTDYTYQEVSIFLFSIIFFYFILYKI